MLSFDQQFCHYNWLCCHYISSSVITSGCVGSSVITSGCVVIASVVLVLHLVVLSFDQEFCHYNWLCCHYISSSVITSGCVGSSVITSGCVVIAPVVLLLHLVVLSFDQQFCHYNWCVVIASVVLSLHRVVLSLCWQSVITSFCVVIASVVPLLHLVVLSFDQEFCHYNWLCCHYISSSVITSGCVGSSVITSGCVVIASVVLLLHLVVLSFDQEFCHYNWLCCHYISSSVITSGCVGSSVIT